MIVLFLIDYSLNHYKEKIMLTEVSINNKIF